MDSFIDSLYDNQRDTAYRHKVKALCVEVKRCTEQIEKLNKEFSEIKREVEAALKEVNSTHSILTEITIQLSNAENYD